MSAHVVIGGVRRGHVRAIRLPPDLARLHPSEADNPPWDRVALWSTTHGTVHKIDQWTGAFAALGFAKGVEVVALTPERLVALDAAVQRWKARYPCAVPAFLGDETRAPTEDRPHVIASGVLLRLVWLQGACRLAVKRCARPALRVA